MRKLVNGSWGKKERISLAMSLSPARRGPFPLAMNTSLMPFDCALLKTQRLSLSEKCLVSMLSLLMDSRSRVTTLSSGTRERRLYLMR